MKRSGQKQIAADAAAETPAPVPLDRWLTAKQVAGHFALNEESVYRWRQEGKIPAQYFKLCGTRRLLFHPDAIALLQAKFEADR
jgi:hypothetical protein